MQETTPPSPRPAPPTALRSRNTLSRLLWILLALSLVLVLPHLAERLQYSLVRGRLRAQSEHAARELAHLSKNAELVTLSDTSRAFRLVAQRIEPSVVHIDVEQQLRTAGRAAFADEWGRPYPRGPRFYHGQGSGVIVDADGYVLTNYHVVQDASRIEVKLGDGRIVSDVDVVGYDVLTDLAVLKIGASELPVADWGDSRQLEVGDWVLAVGNPYGLDRTVTAGILSAKQRRGVAQTVYQDFLQTDAAVNPGNSGGPLLNIKGELVGITTAIVGRAYQGISFAIPSEVVRDVYSRLREHGAVARGWLGALTQELTPQLAASLKITEPGGALVAGVLKGSPAEAAGLKEADVIVEWNGQEVTDSIELPLLVAATEIGSKARMVVIRDGKRLTLEVVVGERPAEEELERRE